MQVSYDYFFSNTLVVCNLHGLTISLLSKLLDAGFISLGFKVLNRWCI